MLSPGCFYDLPSIAEHETSRFMAVTTTSPISTARHRPFDVLRGLVIVLMALDHVRGFIAPMGANPTDFDSTTVSFFLVRWVTHLCAPSFVFLMGVAAALRFAAKPDDTRGFLLKRGLWLIVLEATWVSFCWTWDISKTYLGVLWALGACMVLLSVLCRASSRAFIAIGLALILGLEWANFQPDQGLLRMLVQPGSVTVFGHPVGSAYAPLPWLGVAALGWGMSSWLVRATGSQLRMLGAAMLAIFVVYRSKGWTDPDPWAEHGRLVMTAADFVNPSKYPPSLCFVLMTLGVAMLLLSGPLRRAGRINGVLEVFGRVPMFFYLAHLPLAHILANVFAWSVYGEARVPGTEPVSIVLIVTAWLVVAGLLWPVCRAWDDLKRRRRDLRWLSYL